MNSVRYRRSEGKQSHNKVWRERCLQGGVLLPSRSSRGRLSDPIDGSPPGSAVPGVLQARTLEWVAIAFSNAWKWKVKVKSFSRVRLLATPRTAAHQAPPSTGFSRQEYWSGVPLPLPTNSQFQDWWEEGCQLTLCNHGVTGRHLCRDEDSQSPLAKESPPLRKRRAKGLGGKNKETQWERGREKVRERPVTPSNSWINQTWS